MDAITKSICKMIGLSAAIDGFSEQNLDMLMKMLETKRANAHTRHIARGLIAIASSKSGEINYDFIMEGKKLGALLRAELTHYPCISDLDGGLSKGSFKAEMAMLDIVIDGHDFIKGAKSALKLIEFPEDVRDASEVEGAAALPTLPTPAGVIAVLPMTFDAKGKVTWRVELTPYGSDATFGRDFIEKRDAMGFARFLIGHARDGWAPQVDRSSLQRLNAKRFNQALCIQDSDHDLPEGMMGYCSRGYNPNSDEEWVSLALLQDGIVLAEAFHASSKENDYTILNENSTYSKTRLLRIVDTLMCAMEYDSPVCFV